MKYIYKITNLINNKVYIGKTEISILGRWKDHCKAAENPSDKDYDLYFHRAIRKYGKDNFTIEEIDTSEDSEELKKKEKYWIAYYNSYEKGYNSTLGGDGQCKYNYDDIVNYYLNNNFSITETCKHFKIYDQVVYSALKSKNIDYKQLSSQVFNRTKHNKKILLVEKNIIFNSMKEIDDYFGKQVHGNIRRCLNGVTKKAYGYTWKEIEENEDMGN